MATWNKQIENRNFLSPIGFKFILAKYPKVAYFCQSANIPSMNMNVPEQLTPYRPLPMDGFISYDPLTISFLVDEDLENYLILHNWLRGLGVPDTMSERSDFYNTAPTAASNEPVSLFADGTLSVLNSNFNMNFNVVFKDLIPMGLNALEFNASIDGTEYAMAQVSFRYSSYEIQTADGIRRTQLE